MNELVATIEGLSRGEVLEASRFLASELGAEPDAAQRAAVEPLTENASQNIAEIEQLARLALLSAASVEEYRDAVSRAIEGAGRKEFIFGGAELVVIAAIALSALHVVMSKGKATEEETIKIEEKDGKSVATIHREIKYGIAGKVGTVLKGYFGK